MEDNSDHPLHSSHTVVNTNTVQIYLSKSLGSRSTGTNHVVMQMFAMWCWCGTMLAKLTWIQLRWFPASAPHWSQWRSQRKVISQSSCSALYGPFSSVAGSSALSWWRTSCTPTTPERHTHIHRSVNTSLGSALFHLGFNGWEWHLKLTTMMIVLSRRGME